MAKHLWLLRHGDAVPHGSRPDFDRELTPKGERQARTAGRALSRARVDLDGCYSSPKVRARDTARLACEELGVAFEETPVLEEGFEADDARELLLAHDDGAHVLVVGHDPDFTDVVHALTNARIDFKKGGIAVVKLDGAPALVALLRPAELEPMAG